jgi:hypothetical protein
MKIVFTVSTDNVTEFSELLSEHDLENTITGTTEDGDIMIDVFYSRENRDAIVDLERLAENE